MDLEEAEDLVIEAEVFEGEEGLVEVVAGSVGTALGLVETGVGTVVIEVVMGVIGVAEVGSAVATRAVASEAASVVAETNNLGVDSGNDEIFHDFSSPNSRFILFQRPWRRHWISW